MAAALELDPGLSGSSHARSLQEITAALSRALTPRQVIHASVELGREALHAETSGLWVFNEPAAGATGMVELADSVGYSGEEIARFRWFPLDFPTPLTDAIRSGQPVWIASNADLAKRYPHLADPHMMPYADFAVASVPLRVENRAIGVIAFSFDRSRELEADDWAFLSVLALHCAQALERARLYSESETSKNHLAFIAEASRVLAKASLSLDAVSDAITRLVTQSIGDACALSLLSEDGDALRTVAVHHRNEESHRSLRSLMADPPIPSDETICGRVLRTGVPLVIASADDPGTRGALDPAHRWYFEHYRVKSIAVIPLRSGGRVIGSLAAWRDTDLEPLTQRDSTLLMNLGDRAALSLENARNYEEARDTRVRLEAALLEKKQSERALRFLVESSAVLSSSLDYPATLRVVARLALQRFGEEPGSGHGFADCCGVFLQSPDGVVERLELAHEEPALEERLASYYADYKPYNEGSQGIAAALATGRPQIVSEYDHLGSVIMRGGDEKRQSRARDFNFASYLAVPLIARGKTLGVMSYVRGKGSQRYRMGDLAIAEELAGRAAVAIDNARLYQELLEGDRRKNEFLAMLAHELRNPLAPIVTALQLMKLKCAEPATVERTRDVVERQVKHMARLLDDLLDVARITRGKIELRREAISLQAVVDRAIQSSRPLLESRRHRIETHFPVETLTLHADPTRIEQVLVNLLNNAAKYTDPAGVVSVTIAKAGTEAVVRVRDNGIGIARDAVSRVFGLFEQAGRSLDRSQGGLGIGLTLVKSLVQMHGGRVSARSEGQGKGSEFSVHLPLAADPAPAEPKGALEVHSAGSCRVLVVDDNADAADTLADYLRLEGHDVRVAHDGKVALEEARRMSPDAVLLDIGLPGMDGYKVARRLRARSKSTILIAVSGYGQAEDRRAAKAAGFNHHFLKPVDPALLVPLIVPRANRRTNVTPVTEQNHRQAALAAGSKPW